MVDFLPRDSRPRPLMAICILEMCMKCSKCDKNPGYSILLRLAQWAYKWSQCYRCCFSLPAVDIPTYQQVIILNDSSNRVLLFWEWKNCIISDVLTVLVTIFHCWNAHAIKQYKNIHKNIAMSSYFSSSSVWCFHFYNIIFSSRHLFLDSVVVVCQNFN